MNLSPPLLAAIHAEKIVPVDDLLETVLGELAGCGGRFMGFLQRQRSVADECAERIELLSIGTGESRRISQALGPGSRGCKLDPQALAEIAGSLLDSLEADPPDLLILNRFGKGEAEGGGFRAVIEAACLAAVPVLTVVRPLNVEAWREFSGELGLLLPPERRAVLEWLHGALALPPLRV